MSKIILANPPWEVKDGFGVRSNSRWPHIRKDKYLPFPIYLAYTASVLEKNSIDVKVIDAVAEEYGFQEFLTAVKKEKPEMCFLETSTPSIGQDLKTAKILKSELNTKVFLFGSHVSVFHEKILKENPFLDGVIRGEFEYTIRDISLKKKFDEINGLSYIKSSGDIKINPDRELIKNLDELPFPAWHQFNLNHYQSHLYKSPSMMVITSRGCPFMCTYCLWPDVMYGHKQRFRSPENICDEIEILIKKYGIREIRFDDDTFALNPTHVLSLCDEILRRKINKKITWTCFGHIAQDNEEIYKRIRDAGCRRIDFGIESGSEKILKNIKKTLNPEKAKKVVKLCKKYGLEVYCDFMIGFPFETEKDVKESIKLAKSLDCDFIQISFVIPYPGTRMYNDALKEGFLLKPEQWNAYGGCEPLIFSGHTTPQEFLKLYRRFWLEFYLRPNIIFKKLLKATKSPADALKIFEGFLSFVKRFVI